MQTRRNPRADAPLRPLCHHSVADTQLVRSKGGCLRVRRGTATASAVEAEARLHGRALGESDHLGGCDLEHERFAGVVVTGAIRHLEVP